MTKRTVVTLPVKKIGEVVRTEPIRVLYSAGFDTDYVNEDFTSVASGKHKLIE